MTDNDNNTNNKKRMALIISYRDRLEHLKTFLETVPNYLQKQDIIFQIFLVHQLDSELFNRAKLFNVGYDQIKNGGFDYLCFHDVDLMPEGSTEDRWSGREYSYPERPTHLSYYCSQFDYRDFYADIFGGVVLFRTEDFVKVNGYSNLYQGWGGEDDDVRLRVNHYLGGVDRRKCRYRSLPHETQEHKNPNYRNNQSRYYARMYDKRRFEEVFTDGLNNLKYQVISIHKCRCTNDTLTFENVDNLIFNSDDVFMIDVKI